MLRDALAAFALLSMRRNKPVGWVERSETHRFCKTFGGFRFAQPTLQISGDYSALLLAFTASASTYTSFPIALNFSDISAMPRSASSFETRACARSSG